MNCARQSAQAINQGRRRGGEKVVRNAVNLRVLSGGGAVPASLADNFRERHAIPSSAPGRDDDLGILLDYVFPENLPARLANEPAASGFDQFGNPGLRCDQRFSPLLTEDTS